MGDEVEVHTVGQLQHEIGMAVQRPTTIIILEDGLDQRQNYYKVSNRNFINYMCKIDHY